MTTIPNELIINFNTSIPGYQKIKFEPSMIIKNIDKDNKTLFFNPLIKLNKLIVDKVPENLRKIQFFKSSLFDSLINYMNQTPAKSLLQATKNGYINNNIKVTLDTLLPENSVI